MGGVNGRHLRPSHMKFNNHHHKYRDKKIICHSPIGSRSIVIDNTIRAMSNDVKGFIAGWFAGTYVGSYILRSINLFDVHVSSIGPSTAVLDLLKLSTCILLFLRHTGCGGLILSHPVDTVRVSELDSSRAM